jgi:periplasmic protein TonB
MSLAITGKTTDEQDDTDELSWRRVRWGACFALIVGLHLGAAWIALHRMPKDEPAPAPPLAAVMIDLAPLPVAPPMPPSEIPPGPKQTLSEPPTPPAPELQQPLPEAPPSPAPEIAVPVPPKPKPKPMEHHLPVERRQPPKRIPDKTPPAPATTAPPQVAAPPAPDAAAPAPGASSAQPSNAVPTWQGLLLGRLQQFKRYPYMAQRDRQQGTVNLHFTMDRHGKVLSASVAKSSGFDALDQETLALIHRAEPLPPPPPEVPGDPLELTVPVQFFLK